jgi:hypothetical protein
VILLTGSGYLELLPDAAAVLLHHSPPHHSHGLQVLRFCEEQGVGNLRDSVIDRLADVSGISSALGKPMTIDGQALLSPPAAIARTRRRVD